MTKPVDIRPGGAHHVHMTPTHHHGYVIAVTGGYAAYRPGTGTVTVPSIIDATVHHHELAAVAVARGIGTDATIHAVDATWLRDDR